jgi:glucose/arabinose dehydrogenase
MCRVRLRAAAVAAGCATFAVVLAGAAAAAAVPVVGTVEVTITDSGLRLSRSSVPAGTVAFRVTNRGVRPHDLVVTASARTRVLPPGKTETITVALAAARVYVLRSTPGGSARAARLRTVAPVEPVAGNGVQATLVAALGAPLTFAVSPPGDTARLVVLRQDGLILLLRNGVVQPTPFLDLRSLVKADGEKGLLGLAFAPDYRTSGLFYVYYNDVDGNVNVVEYRRSRASADTADPRSARRLIYLVKPAADHNGGMMQFGPDGDLYIGVGDGGADPPTIPIGIYGQTLDDLFGSILRIDPRHGDPYAIPAGNPFRDTPGARPEIVAYGLRNPWRFWIDAQTDTMWIGDVGQESQEEIDRLPLDQLGANFGWPCKEGTITPPAVQQPVGCATAELTPPVYAYPHSPTRCSVIAGVVARDPRLTAHTGRFLWADLCDQHVYATDPSAPLAPSTLDLAPIEAPTSFGVDARNRIYVTTANGDLYRLDPAGTG